ncbi:hypothetical protein KAW65_06710 [candidate division WOR-3 bacterium]|nr:hypothetical protein [candidate division WOR-3 bacterium]
MKHRDPLAERIIACCYRDRRVRAGTSPAPTKVGATLAVAQTENKINRD